MENNTDSMRNNVECEQNTVIKKAIRALKNLNNDEEIRKIEINSVFDTLNALEYNVNFIETKDSEELLQTCMNILPSANDHLLSKWCHLVTNLISRQQVLMQGNNMKILMEYVVTKINVSGTWSLPDLLSLLSVLLQSGGSEAEMFWEMLVGDKGILLKFCASNYPDKDVHHITLKCFENLLAKKQNENYPKEEILLNCFSVLLTCLKAGTSVATDNTSNCKLIVTTLKALQNLLLGWKIIPIGQLGILLSVLKFYLFHGQPGQGSFSPVCLYPTVTNQFSIQQTRNQPSYPRLIPQKRRNRRKVKNGKKGNVGKKDKEDEDSLSEGNSSDTGCPSHQRFTNMQSSWKPNLTPPWLTSSSDSEYSDSEGNQLLKLRAVQSLVRQHAFTALQAVIRVTDKKSMFGYWLSFLPDSPSSTLPQSQTILVTILKDPSPQVRAAAISVLTDLLTGSKQFLMVADESVIVRTAFIPLSATLGSLVRELHRCLLLCLIAENSAFILIQLLKCYVVLVNNIPYHRFHPDLLIRLIKHLHPLLHHKDSQVQVACLSVMGSIICVQPVPEEVALTLEDPGNCRLEELDQAMSDLTCERTQLDKKEESDKSKYKLLEHRKEIPWLIRLCQQNILANDKIPLPVQLESLQVMSLFVKAYFGVVRKHLDIFEDLILNGLQNQNSFLQLHSSKLLEAVGSGISNDVKTACHDNEHISAKDGCLTLDKAIEFWQKLLKGPIPQCLQNENHPTLRATCCNCLSTITSEILDHLTKTLKILCLTLMLGLGDNKDPNVKGAAIRCLGIYVLFPCLGEDASFIMDAGNVIIDAVKDDHFGVRTKASWSLGNLSNALLSNRDDWPDFSLDVPDVFLYSIGEAAIHASNDHDNVRTNAVRTLGNLLHYLPENLLGKERMKMLIAESISALLLNLKTRFVKVRWNSCYALGKVLQNLALLKSSLLPMDQIIGALLGALREGNNFKVCINAAISLSSITQRELYGVHFFDIWKQIILSLSKTHTDVDFRELRHKDNFCNQLCLSLCHLACLLQIDDLSHIYDITLCSVDSLIPSMKKLSQLENSDGKVEKTANHIECLMQSSELNDEQNIVLNALKKLVCSALP